VSRASWAVVCQEKAQLEEGLRQKKKCCASDRCSPPRRPSSAILGIKVVFSGDAANDGSAGAARMQLLVRGKGEPQELTQLNWVEIGQGMPYFLASVTLVCYDA
jgi:hypothetical protein